MSLFTIIDTLLFAPLELLFEVIYAVANRVINDPGLSIVVLSLVMNFLVLPLYMRADAMQEEQRDIEMRLQKGVAHIKKTFSGDERMMMLQTYYRQNHYKPTSVLKGAVSLFLEIPFFIAAYRFLSGLQLLNGVALGPIGDLGSPDGMLIIAGHSFNILPVIMTAVNLVSCVIFTKGSPLRSKIQLYAMAVFFLFFLYTSPSGLVLYWTLNNIFSLVKTIFYKLKNPGKVLSVMASAAGVVVFVYGVFVYESPSLMRTAFFGVCGVLMQLPLLYHILKNRIPFNFAENSKTGNKKIFFGGGIFLSVLTGGLIPSAVISSSPQEFVELSYYYHPLWFVLSAFCLAFGIFVIWMGVFYWLAKPSVRPWFDRLIWIVSGVALVDYMFFGRNLGILSSSLQFENGLEFSGMEKLVNLAVVFLVAAAFLVVCMRWKKLVSDVLVIGVLAMVVLSAVNVVKINGSVKVVKQQLQEQGDAGTSDFKLSKNGKNVVILMLDRAMGEYVPYMFNEKPELKQQFSGFVYYPNTISFGPLTNFGTPPIYGGYEYTPIEMNRRSNELLVEKHNEALKVLPVLFSQNGYEATWCGPTYANYQWIPDLSVFDDCPGVRACQVPEGGSSIMIAERRVQNNKRNFFCYGMLKAVPLCFQKVVYNEGIYNQADHESVYYGGQIAYDNFTSTGMNAGFMTPYNILESLPELFEITEDGTNTFLMMTNDTTHEPMLLQEPDYVPAQSVDNTEYEKANAGRFTLDGRTLKMENILQVTHYQTNMAVMLQLGKWFDHMRENGVYDNTRIILVSDHGRGIYHFDDFLSEDNGDFSFYYPLLMVKDFESEGFTTSEEFMTNGDVPTLAMEGIIEDPHNPFTGKAIDSSAKEAPFQYVISSSDWEIDKNNGYTFLPGKWYTVHDDMRNPDNWEIIAMDAVLPLDGQ